MIKEQEFPFMSLTDLQKLPRKEMNVLVKKMKSCNKFYLMEKNYVRVKIDVKNIGGN